MILPKFCSCLFWKYWIYDDFVHVFSSNTHSTREVSTFWSKRALQKDNFVKRPVPKRRFCETAPSKKTILWNGGLQKDDFVKRHPPKRRFCETALPKKTILWNGPPQKDDFVTHITNVCHKIVFLGACVSQKHCFGGCAQNGHFVKPKLLMFHEMVFLWSRNLSQIDGFQKPTICDIHWWCVSQIDQKNYQKSS